MGRLITGKVFDAETNQPLPFAVVAITDAEGNPTQPLQSTSTFSDGSFNLETNGEGSHVGVKYTGYPKMTKPIIGNTDFNFPLKAGINLAQVEVKANESESKKIIPSWILWTGISIAVAGTIIFIGVKTKS